MVVQRRYAVAEGTWRGHVEPIVLSGGKSGQQVTATKLIVTDGPSLHLNQDSREIMTVPTVGKWAVLVRSDKAAIPWTWQPGESVAVTGWWGPFPSAAYRNGEALHAQVNGRPSPYPVIVVDRIEAAPTTAPSQ